MKHKLYGKLTAALCALILLLFLAPTAQAADEPAVSSNRNANDYDSGTGNWAATVKSYLFENPSGGLTRVEYLGDQKIIVEDYSSSFQLQSSRTIPFELSIWGGFFAGQTYNFFIFGQNNFNDSDSVETIRVVKYDKNWNRLGQYSLYGGNIYMPFKSGSLRCTEYNGYLYIHSCRQMYSDGAGTHHQANMTLQLRESDMSCIQYIDRGAGYVSHSFNQFILVDSEQNVVILDHGDAYPRSAVIHRFTTKAGAKPVDIASGYYAYAGQLSQVQSLIYTFPGYAGNNLTGATLGGLAETSTGYVTAFARNDEGKSHGSRQIYLGYTHKADLASSWVQVSTENTISVPQLAPTGPDGGYILWNTWYMFPTYPGPDLCYASYDSNGAIGATIMVEDAPLSDCAPILYNGKSVWYTTDDSVPTFYALDASGVTATKANGASAARPSYLFTDVPTTHWAFSAIKEMVDNGLANGVGDGLFEPSGEMTAAQFSTFLARAFYGVAANASGSPWYQPYTSCMQQNGILNGVNFSADAAISRYDMAQMLYNVLVNKGAAIPGGDKLAAAQASIPDWASVPSGYQTAVAACYAAGLIGGMEDGSFNGSGAMTRAQGCTVLSRAMAYVPGSAASKPGQAYYSAEEFRSELIRLVNEVRAADGLSPVQESEELMWAAQRWAEQNAGLDSPNGMGIVLWADDPRPITIWGESHFAGAFQSPEETKEFFTSALRISGLTHIGTGVYRADDGQIYGLVLCAKKEQTDMANYRAEALRMINQLRAERGLPALQESPLLDIVAQLDASGKKEDKDDILSNMRVEGYSTAWTNTFTTTSSLSSPSAAISMMGKVTPLLQDIYNTTITHIGIGYCHLDNGQDVFSFCVGQVE